MEQIKVEHLNVFHEKGGDQSLVLLHGAWGKGWQWLDNFFAYFSQYYDSYAIDLTAHGESVPEKKVNFLKLGIYVEDVNKVVSSLSSKPILIAHSMGSLIAQRYLKKYPNSVSKLILLAPACRPGVWRATAKALIHQPFSFLLANLKLNIHPIVNSPKKVKRVLFTKSYDHPKMKELVENIEGESYVAYIQMLLHFQFKPNSLEHPVLVVGGDEDYLFSVKNFKNTAKRLKADLKIFEKKGHHLFMQEGWEEIASFIQNWITEDNSKSM